MNVSPIVQACIFAVVKYRNNFENLKTKRDDKQLQASTFEIKETST